MGGAAWWPPFYLRRRSAVREVLSAQGLVVALADSGVCAAYDQDSTQPLCFLNVEADEIIRSLFINHLNGTLITVSVFSGGKGTCLPACLQLLPPDMMRAMSIPVAHRPLPPCRRRLSGPAGARHPAGRHPRGAPPGLAAPVHGGSAALAGVCRV